MSEALWTVDDVMAHLSVSRNTVYRIVKCGDLPAIRIGRTMRFEPKEVRWYVQRRKLASSGVNPSSGTLRNAITAERIKASSVQLIP